MNNTIHYSLRKPEADDRILRTDFDHNWDAIDTAIHGAAASAEAAQAAVDSEATARQNAISAESSARQSAITAESSARQNAITTLQTELAKCGKFKIVTGSYTGNGTYNRSNQLTLTFSAAPLLLIVAGKTAMFAVRGSTTSPTSGGYYANTSWSGTSVSWYSDSAASHMNENGQAYYYIALLPTE